MSDFAFYVVAVFVLVIVLYLIKRMTSCFLRVLLLLTFVAVMAYVYLNYFR